MMWRIRCVACNSPSVHEGPRACSRARRLPNPNAPDRQGTSADRSSGPRLEPGPEPGTEAWPQPLLPASRPPEVLREKRPNSENSSTPTVCLDLYECYRSNFPFVTGSLQCRPLGLFWLQFDTTKDCYESCDGEKASHPYCRSRERPAAVRG